MHLPARLACKRDVIFVVVFFFVTLDTGPRRPSSLESSDTNVFDLISKGRLVNIRAFQIYRRQISKKYSTRGPQPVPTGVVPEDCGRCAGRLKASRLTTMRRGSQPSHLGSHLVAQTAPATSCSALPALRVGPNPGLEFEPVLVWQRRILPCQPRNRKSEIVGLVQPRGLLTGVVQTASSTSTTSSRCFRIFTPAVYVYSLLLYTYILSERIRIFTNSAAGVVREDGGRCVGRRPPPLPLRPLSGPDGRR